VFLVSVQILHGISLIQLITKEPLNRLKFLTEYQTWSFRRIRNVNSLKLSSSNESASSRTMCDNLDRSYNSITQKVYKLNSALKMTLTTHLMTFATETCT